MPVDMQRALGAETLTNNKHQRQIKKENVKYFCLVVSISGEQHFKRN